MSERIAPAYHQEGISAPAESGPSYQQSLAAQRGMTSQHISQVESGQMHPGEGISNLSSQFGGGGGGSQGELHAVGMRLALNPQARIGEAVRSHIEYTRGYRPGNQAMYRAPAPEASQPEPEEQP